MEYPIPVISVKGLCDVEISLDQVTVSTKRRRLDTLVRVLPHRELLRRRPFQRPDIHGGVSDQDGKIPGDVTGIFPFSLVLTQTRTLYTSLPSSCAGKAFSTDQASAQYFFKLVRPTRMAVRAGSMPSNSMAMVSSYPAFFKMCRHCFTGTLPWPMMVPRR